MITEQTLRIKNQWWEDRQYIIKETNFPKRDLYYNLVDNLEHTLILNIVGLRRVGKSTILKQLIGYLINKKINPNNIFYFIFDYASQIQKTEFLDELLYFYFKKIINKPTLSFNENEQVYVLLDEIQYIDNWQAILKRYYDLSDKRIKFIITGSQSVLLKGQYRESLAGRIFDFYLPPMSFREFIKINKEKVETFEIYDLLNLPDRFSALSQFDLYNGKKIADLSREYIITGQFPETRKIKISENRYEYIVESVIGKVQEDCINLFNIEKTDEFKLITQHLLNNISSIFELINIGREVGIAKKTIEKYIEYLKKSYIIEIVHRYHKSLIKRGRILKKVYTPCVNFVCALNHYQERHFDEVPQIFGKIIENLVYNVLSLKYKGDRMHDPVTFWRRGEKEIDFLVLNDNKYLPVEVKFSKNFNSKDLTVMTNYIKEKKIEYGVVVTKNEIDEKEINGQRLYYLPYYLILMMI